MRGSLAGSQLRHLDQRYFGVMKLCSPGSAESNHVSTNFKNTLFIVKISFFCNALVYFVTCDLLHHFNVWLFFFSGILFFYLDVKIDVF